MNEKKIFILNPNATSSERTSYEKYNHSVIIKSHLVYFYQITIWYFPVHYLFASAFLFLEDQLDLSTTDISYSVLSAAYDSAKS